MSVTTERLTANSRIGIEALIALANSNFATFEKLAALNFSTTRSMFEDGISYAKAVLSAKRCAGTRARSASPPRRQYSSG